jgi:hypothetical protein
MVFFTQRIDCRPGKTTITGYIRDVNGGMSAGKCLTIGHRPRAVIDFAAKIKIRLTFYGLIR